MEDYEAVGGWYTKCAGGGEGYPQYFLYKHQPKYTFSSRLSIE